MHTLIIEGTFKPGKKTEFVTAWNNEILPTLKKQQGFVDEILLSVEAAETFRIAAGKAA
jgi:hypothetical protein